MGTAGSKSPAPGPHSRRFRPGFWLTVFALGALVVLIGLGAWQLQRLEWKTAMIAEREARLAAAPIALPAEIPDPAAIEFQRVELAGRFLHERELHLGGRTRKKVVGFHVVTPLRLDDGREILVDRGWVPAERRDPAGRPEGLVAGEVAFEAVLRRGGWGGGDLLRPDNDPVGNYWIWPDLPAMAAAAGLERPLIDVYAVAAAPTAPSELPIAATTEIDIRNDHLQYALTWFALAVALVVIYILMAMRRADPRD